MKKRSQEKEAMNNNYENGKSSKSNGVRENGTAVYNNYEDYGLVKNIWHYTFVPVMLMLTTPNIVIFIWYICTKCDGSVLKLVELMTSKGFLNGMAQVWGSIHFCSPFSLKVIFGYFAWAALLMKTLPGPRVEGPISAKGNIPVYKDNGFACYVVTVIAFVALTAVLKQYGTTPTLVYDHFGEFLVSLTVVGLVFCVFLYFKGLYFPSSTDCGSSGNVIFDYFWGTELYPHVLGIDVKVFTNCRFGMTVWPLLVLIFSLKSYEMHGFVDSIWVSCVLQMVYFTKFFWWESGYMRTIDIMLDRAGYCICWGCLVYVPGLYASVSLYLVNHPVILGPMLALTILGMGLFGIAVNYLADWQKQLVRETDGNCTIWGKKPEILRAEYTVSSGEIKQSILLLSGYWGIARHFHYIPELFLAFCWSLPALFENVMPYGYFIFLIILLVQRTFRDDEKCSKKYTRYWKTYCTRVPYKMIPYVF